MSITMWMFVEITQTRLVSGPSYAKLLWKVGTCDARCSLICKKFGTCLQSEWIDKVSLYNFSLHDEKGLLVFTVVSIVVYRLLKIFNVQLLIFLVKHVHHSIRSMLKCQPQRANGTFLFKQSFNLLFLYSQFPVCSSGIFRKKGIEAENNDFILHIQSRNRTESS